MLLCSIFSDLLGPKRSIISTNNAGVFGENVLARTTIGIHISVTHFYFDETFNNIYKTFTTIDIFLYKKFILFFIN